MGELIPIKMSKSYIEGLLDDLMLLNRGNKIQKLKKNDPPYGRHIEDFYKNLLKYAVEKGYNYDGYNNSR